VEASLLRFGLRADPVKEQQTIKKSLARLHNRLSHKIDEPERR
jgi:hypothetical protein